MGKWDYKNFVLHIKIRENLTDSRFVEFMKGWNFYLNDMFKFQDSIEPLYNPVAEKIIQFLLTYDKIDLCPERYNSYEPISKFFDKNNLNDPICCIAFPAGSLYLRKKRKFDVVIENLWYGLIFDPDIQNKVIPSKKKIGEYLGDIKIYISKSVKCYTMRQLQTIINDFCSFLQTDYGEIIDQENTTILYKFSDMV